MPNNPGLELEPIISPLRNLLNEILSIVYEDKSKISELTQDLLDQILISALLLHLNSLAKDEKNVDVDKIKELISNNNTALAMKEIASTITPQKLSSYLADSSTIIITNFAQTIQADLNSEKIKKIEKIYQKLS